MIPVEKNPIVRGWFEGRRVLVAGLGKSGAAAAGLLSRLGARVSVTEKKSKAQSRPWLRLLPKGTSVEWGTHRFLSRPWDIVVASPGVPASSLAPARARSIPVWGELELGYRVLALAGRWPAWSAAITGTNGKTTTTALLGAIFKSAGRPTVVAGNIGVPLCAVVNDVTARTALALEVSSYQLETAEAFRPAVGAVLNVTPDHLARHGDMESYARAKFRLFQSQGVGDAAVLNGRDPWCRRLASSVSGQVYWFGDRSFFGPPMLSTGEKEFSSPLGRRCREAADEGCAVVLSANQIPHPALSQGEREKQFGGLRKLGDCFLGDGVFWDGKYICGRGLTGRWSAPAHLPGRHNIENALAAVACARALGVPSGAIARGLSGFRGVEHRLELVRTWNGIRFINDSKATNVDSTRVALEAFPGPLTVILGGEDKGAPYSPLLPLLRKKARAVLLIGEASSKIERDLAGLRGLERCDTLARAVDRAARSARPGEAVLLSPACASFDQFENFEHRGRCFKEFVGAL